MQYLNTSHGTDILEALVDVIVENRNYLSEVDGAIGDGDHGINMAKGFRLCGESIQGQSLGLSKALGTLATTLMGSIGGSMGPLYGSLFLGMSNAIKEREALDARAFGDMLTGGLNALQGISDAQVGDKCLLDTLVPAVDDYRRAADNGEDFPAALDAFARVPNAAASPPGSWKPVSVVPPGWANALKATSTPVPSPAGCCW